MKLCKSLLWISFFAILIFILVLYIYYEVNCPTFKKIEVKSNKIKNDIRILQISDYHNKKFKNKNKIVLDEVKNLKPDIIVITGDLISRSTKNCDNAYNFIKELIKINPNIYFVNGNHERDNMNIPADEFDLSLSKLGVRVLINQGLKVNINGDYINICGVDDIYSHRCDLSKALYGTQSNLFTLLLSHEPDIVLKYSSIPCDLILSGHTHGGQIRLPLIGAIIAPGQGFFPKYNKGLYKLSNDTTLYVDSGLGTAKFFPIRFLNRSQMSLIKISQSL